MLSKLILPDIQELIDQKKWEAIKSVFSDIPPQDIAALLSMLDEKERTVVFRLIPATKTISSGILESWEHLEISCNDKFVVFRNEFILYRIRLLNASYPDYTSIMPQGIEYVFSLSEQDKLAVKNITTSGKAKNSDTDIRNPEKIFHLFAEGKNMFVVDGSTSAEKILKLDAQTELYTPIECHGLLTSVNPLFLRQAVEYGFGTFGISDSSTPVICAENKTFFEELAKGKISLEKSSFMVFMPVRADISKIYIF